jgi:hypothetical protein
LSACSNSTNAIPNEISDQKFWEDSKELVALLETNIKDISPLSEKQKQLFVRYEKEYFSKNESGELEKNLFIDIVNLKHAFNNYLVMQHPETSESKNRYLNEYLDLLNKIKTDYNISL